MTFHDADLYEPNAEAEAAAKTDPNQARCPECKPDGSGEPRAHCPVCAGTGRAGPMSFEVPSSTLPELDARIKQLTRRGTRVSRTTGYEASFGYAVLGEIKDPLMRTWEGKLVVAHHAPRNDIVGYRRMSVIRFHGAAPVISDHRFVARLEHHDAGNVISKSPEFHDVELEAYRTAPPRCEHCGTTRRRTETFVLARPSGSLIQIGRNCLADYLRSEDVAIALKWWSLLDFINGMGSGGDGDGEGYGHGGREVSTHHFLACACASVREFGFIGSKAAEQGKPTTSMDAAFLMGPLSSMADADTRAEWKRRQPTEEDFQMAEAIEAWLRDLQPRGDFEHNLKIAVLDEVLGRRSAGIVACAPRAYERYLGIEAQRRDRTERSAAAGYFGEVGKRVLLTMTLDKKFSFDTQYGINAIFIMRDAAGHVFKWKASNWPDCMEGDLVQGKCTIKEHKDYKGTLQTVLTRCSIKVVCAKCMERHVTEPIPRLNGVAMCDQCYASQKSDYVRTRVGDDWAEVVEALKRVDRNAETSGDRALLDAAERSDPARFERIQQLYPPK